MERRKTEKLDGVIGRLLRENNLDEKFSEKRVISSWEEVLGTNIARYTSKLYFKNKVLYVHISSSIMRHELFLSKIEIKKKLNDYIGKYVVNDIIFR